MEAHTTIADTQEMTHGPTQGADEVANRNWHASPGLANTIRLVAFLVPLLAAWLAIRLSSGFLYRPDGRLGLGAWILQAAAIGYVVSNGVSRLTRTLLPLASLYAMSLVFPDRAPSRFGIALRSSTIKQLRRRIGDVASDGLGSSTQEAANTAVGLVGALGSHDRLTRGHTERVRAYADMIAEELGLPAEDRAKLAWGAMLHDIGKLTVDPAILNKQGRPDKAEWEQLKQHPARSTELLAPLIPWLGDWLLAASQHHERWDGTGYPLGLSGYEISLAGRITAVADAYDVITSTRSYKKPLSNEAARKELVRCAGSQFDPAIVRAFLNVSLGHRWAAGPLAWLTEIPGLHAGATTAGAATPAVVATSMTAVGSAALLLSTSVASAPPDTLAMADAAAPITATAPEVPTTPSLPAPSTTLLLDDELPGTTTEAPPPSTSQPTTTTVLIDELGPTTTAITLEPLITLETTLPTLPPTPPTSTTVESLLSGLLRDVAVQADSGKNIKIYPVDTDDATAILAWDFSSLSIVKPPTHGQIQELHDDHLHYKADRDYVGTDSFDYELCTYQGACESATVTITLTDED